MRRRTALIAAVLLALAAALPAAAREKGGEGLQADPKERGRGAKVKVDYRGGGPPPWAPAHGYRRHAGAPAHGTGGYSAPFHIDVGRCNRGALGAVLGGAAGGVLGSRAGGGMGRDGAIIGGTIVGVIVGQRIGKWMDDVDQACVRQVLEHTPTGRPVEWVNPDNGVIYHVTPSETYRLGDDRYCREFQTQAQIGGRTERLYGTACRQPDGSWERVSR